MGWYKDYEPKNKKNAHVKDLSKKPKRQVVKNKDYLTIEERKINLKKWTTFFRRNVHIFVDWYLGVELHLFQKITLYLMAIHPSFVVVASRGISKSFMIALYCIAISILKPNSLIVIGAGTKKQANLIIKEKIKKELYKFPNIAREIADIKTGQGEGEVLFHNGSSIIVVPAADSARGKNMCVYIIFYYKIKSLKEENVMEEKNVNWTNDEINYLVENFNNKSYKQLSEYLKRTVNAVRLKSSKLGFKRTSQYHYDHDYFENIDTEDKAYWLGFIYADGYVVNNPQSRNYELGIQLKQSDIEHLKKFNKCINGNIEIKIIHKVDNISDRYLCSIRLYSKKIIEDLNKHGIVQNKSFIIEFPTNLQDDLLKHFIRGYFDGDGSIWIYKRKNILRCKFTSGSKIFLDSLSDILKLKNINTFIVKSNNCFDLYIAGRDSTRNFLEYIYDDSNIFLDRKFDRYITHKNKLLPR